MQNKNLNRCIIQVSGKDAKVFLQGLVTNDLSLLANQPMIYSLMLSPKGRYEFDFFIFIKNDNFIIDIHVDLVESFIRKVNFYKLVSSVDISILENFSINVIKENNINNYQNAISSKDPRHNDLGYRLLSENTLNLNKTNDNNVYNIQEYNNLRHGLCILESQEVSKNAIPLEYGFDELNAISYSKGCYLGQEFTNACKNKLEIRKRVLVASLDLQSITMDDVIFNQHNEEVGKVVYNSNGHIFGLIKMLNHDNNIYFINNTKILFNKPNWITTFSLN